MLPIIDERTSADWVARGQEVTVRRLMDEVEWTIAAREGCCSPIKPPPPGASLTLLERQMCARPEWESPDAEITFSAPASVVALFQTAVLAFEESGDALWTGFERLLRHVQAEWEAQPRHREHHLRGIHAGRVRAWGEAPDTVTWELGVRAGRKPLLRTQGDRYM